MNSRVGTQFTLDKQDAGLCPRALPCKGHVEPTKIHFKSGYYWVSKRLLTTGNFNFVSIKVLHTQAILKHGDKLNCLKFYENSGLAFNLVGG